MSIPVDGLSRGLSPSPDVAIALESWLRLAQYDDVANSEPMAWHGLWLATDASMPAICSRQQTPVSLNAPALIRLYTASSIVKLCGNSVFQPRRNALFRFNTATIVFIRLY